MDNRDKLQHDLEAIIGEGNVYFQPPESIKLSYPCIVYERNDIGKFTANDKLYMKNESYIATLITKDPDDSLIDSILELDYCSFNRHFVIDNLIHEVFTIYIRRK